MWICSKCNARVEPTFDVCWRCGTTYQGEEDPDFVAADESPPIEDPTDYLRLDVGKPIEDELPGPPLELVACFESNSLVEVKFVADELAARGIPSALQNTAHAGWLPPAAFSNYPCRVVVRAEDLDRARSVVEDDRARRRERQARGEH
jgi:hypothetical protein